MEGPAQIADLVRSVRAERNHRQDEIVGLVERIEDLVLRHGDGVRARDATLYLDETEAPRAGDSAFDVVAELLGLPVDGHKAEAALDFHYDLPRPRRSGLGIDCRLDRRL